MIVLVDTVLRIHRISRLSAILDTLLISSH
nr:MAG TPA: hypothetical protein [Caudoviricetes sp.]DAV24039.1 MAG TPA: hypothetical protein [Bacteriophage sp.]